MDIQLMPFDVRLRELLDEGDFSITDFEKSSGIGRGKLYKRILKPGGYRTENELNLIANALGMSVRRMKGTDVLLIRKECQSFLEDASQQNTNGDHPLFEKAKWFLEIARGVSERLDALILLGEMFIKIEEDDKALFYLEKAVDLLDDTNDTSRMLQVLNNISSVYLRQDRYSEIEALLARFHDSITGFLVPDNFRSYALLMWKRAIANYRLDDHDGALDCFDRAQMFLKITGDTVSLSEMYFQVAENYFEKQMYDDALSKIEECQDINTTNTEWKMSRDLLTVKILYALGRMDEVLEILNATIENQAAASHKALLARFYLLRAKILDSSDDARIVTLLVPNEVKPVQRASLIYSRLETALPQKTFFLVENSVPDFVYEKWFR